MERFRSPPEAAVTPGLDLFSGCRLCEVTCPSQVSIQEYIRRAQNQGAGEKGRSLRDWVLGRRRLLGRLGSMTTPLANFGNSNPLFRVLMERFVGIHRRRPLPKYQWLTFERWFKRHPRPITSRRKVAYFYGCWVNYNDRRLGERAVAILERNGIEVIVPSQQCCGIPAVVNSNLDLARRYGQQNVRHLTPAAEEVDIVASSTSGRLMLKQDYRHLLDIPGSAVLDANTYR